MRFLRGGLIQAIVGILQQLGFLIPGAQSIVGYWGTFESSDYFAGYMATIIPFGLGVYLLADKEERRMRNLRIVGLAMFLSGVLTLPSTFSRASWIAVLAGFAIVAFVRWDILALFQRSSFAKVLILACCVGISAVLMVMAAQGYKLKPDSVGGRLLIWKITLSMIARSPLTGIGFDRFPVEYENFQADYFATSSRTSYEEIVAGHVRNAYNEPLQVLAELGIIGAVLFVSILKVAVLGGNRQVNTMSGVVISARASIVAFVVFSCFSVPMSVLPTFITFFFLLAVISANSPSTSDLSVPFTVQRPIGLMFLLGSLLLALHTFSLHRAYYEWKLASNSTRSMDLADAESRYEALFPTFQRNGKFLFMYGATLALARKYHAGIRLMEEAKRTL